MVTMCVGMGQGAAGIFERSLTGSTNAATCVIFGLSGGRGREAHTLAAGCTGTPLAVASGHRTFPDTRAMHARRAVAIAAPSASCYHRPSRLEPGAGLRDATFDHLAQSSWRAALARGFRADLNRLGRALSRRWATQWRAADATCDAPRAGRNRPALPPSTAMRRCLLRCNACWMRLRWREHRTSAHVASSLRLRCAGQAGLHGCTTLMHLATSTGPSSHRLEVGRPAF